MGTTVAPKLSLLEEFQSLLKLITDDDPLTCHGRTRKNERCKSRVSRAAKKRLLALSFDVIECLKNGRDGIEVLLQEASSLAMCIKNHQLQAVDKYETWMGMIPLTTDDSSLDDAETKSKHPLSTASSSEDLLLMSGDAEPLADPDHTSNLLHRSTSPNSSFDDSGYISADEDTPIKTLPSHSASNKYAAQASITPKKNPEVTPKRLPPKTPQRPPPVVSTDSGISLTFDTPVDGQKGEVEPVSPLAYKVEESNPFMQHAQLPQQAAAPTGHNLLQNTICPGPSKPEHMQSTFVPFHNPARKLAKYIRRPLTSNALEKGFLYIFQVDGHTLNKIGYVSKRKNDPSIDVSFDHRMEEHKRCGWEPKPVFRCLVPHAERVEKLIHRHLEKSRRKETNLCKCCKGPACRKCDHSTHMEWFETPLQEITVIAKAWIRWILTKPYVQKNGKAFLSAEWDEKLNNVQVHLEDDYWLQWLGCNLPKEQDHAEDPNRIESPSIATNMCTIEDIPFRLKHSKTWPRQINPASTHKY